LVETNWVVDVATPSLAENTTALELRERGRSGELSLHVPAVSLMEARRVVATRMPRAQLNAIRGFVHRAVDEGQISRTAADATYDSLARFQQFTVSEREHAPARITALASDASISVFPLDERMLQRSVDLVGEVGVALAPFDQSILAAVLVRGKDLRDAGHLVSFATLDSDLLPWDRNGAPLPLLSLFERAGIEVFETFALAG
jgi:hypothetical protein